MKKGKKLSSNIFAISSLFAVGAYYSIDSFQASSLGLETNNFNSDVNQNKKVKPKGSNSIVDRVSRSLFGYSQEITFADWTRTPEGVKAYSQWRKTATAVQVLTPHYRKTIDYEKKLLTWAAAKKRPLNDFKKIAKRSRKFARLFRDWKETNAPLELGDYYKSDTTFQTKKNVWQNTATPSADDLANFLKSSRAKVNFLEWVKSKENLALLKTSWKKTDDFNNAKTKWLNFQNHKVPKSSWLELPRAQVNFANWEKYPSTYDELFTNWETTSHFAKSQADWVAKNPRNRPLSEYKKHDSLWNAKYRAYQKSKQGQREIEAKALLKKEYGDATKAWSSRGKRQWLASDQVDESYNDWIKTPAAKNILEPLYKRDPSYEEKKHKWIDDHFDVKSKALWIRDRDATSQYQSWKVTLAGRDALINKWKKDPSYLGSKEKFIEDQKKILTKQNWLEDEDFTTSYKNWRAQPSTNKLLNQIWEKTPHYALAKKASDDNYDKTVGQWRWLNGPLSHAYFGKWNKSRAGKSILTSEYSKTKEAKNLKRKYINSIFKKTYTKAKWRSLPAGKTAYTNWLASLPNDQQELKTFWHTTTNYDTLKQQFIGSKKYLNQYKSQALSRDASLWYDDPNHLDQIKSLWLKQDSYQTTFNQWFKKTYGVKRSKEVWTTLPEATQAYHKWRLGQTRDKGFVTKRPKSLANQWQKQDQYQVKKDGWIDDFSKQDWSTNEKTNFDDKYEAFYKTNKNQFINDYKASVHYQQTRDEYIAKITNQKPHPTKREAYSQLRQKPAIDFFQKDAEGQAFWTNFLNSGFAHHKRWVGHIFDQGGFYLKGLEKWRETAGAKAPERDYRKSPTYEQDFYRWFNGEHREYYKNRLTKTPVSLYFYVWSFRGTSSIWDEYVAYVKANQDQIYQKYGPFDKDWVNYYKTIETNSLSRGQNKYLQNPQSNLDYDSSKEDSYLRLQYNVDLDAWSLTRANGDETYQKSRQSNRDYQKWKDPDPILEPVSQDHHLAYQNHPQAQEDRDAFYNSNDEETFAHPTPYKATLFYSSKAYQPYFNTWVNNQKDIEYQASSQYQKDYNVFANADNLEGGSIYYASTSGGGKTYNADLYKAAKSSFLKWEEFKDGLYRFTGYNQKGQGYKFYINSPQGPKDYATHKALVFKLYKKASAFQSYINAQAPGSLFTNGEKHYLENHESGANYDSWVNQEIKESFVDSPIFKTSFDDWESYDTGQSAYQESPVSTRDYQSWVYALGERPYLNNEQYQSDLNTWSYQKSNGFRYYEASPQSQSDWDQRLSSAFAASPQHKATIATLTRRYGKDFYKDSSQFAIDYASWTDPLKRTKAKYFFANLQIDKDLDAYYASRARKKQVYAHSPRSDLDYQLYVKDLKKTDDYLASRQEKDDFKKWVSFENGKDTFKKSPSVLEFIKREGIDYQESGQYQLDLIDFVRNSGERFFDNFLSGPRLENFYLNWDDNKGVEPIPDDFENDPKSRYIEHINDWSGSVINGMQAFASSTYAQTLFNNYLLKQRQG